MRIVHMSDTHLGYSAYSKIDPVEGVNQREADIYAAFQRAVDKVIELRPDIVIHSGDLFDTVRPQNRAIDFALRQLIRLSEAGIETVLISGNHSTPRLRETGSIFRIFVHLEQVHSVHEPGERKIVFGDTTITAIPHSVSPSLPDLVSAVRVSKGTKFNVLVLHAGILDSETYKRDEFNEQNVPLASIGTGWDYVALGHFHRFAKVRENAYYTGSTERLGFGEAAHEKGLVEVDLETIAVKPIRTMKMPKTAKMTLVACTTVCAAFSLYAYFSYSVSKTGRWPRSWPKELEPLRNRSCTLTYQAVEIHIIPFTNRAEFEAAWPHI